MSKPTLKRSESLPSQSSNARKSARITQNDSERIKTVSSRSNPFTLPTPSDNEPASPPSLRISGTIASIVEYGIWQGIEEERYQALVASAERELKLCQELAGKDVQGFEVRPFIGQPNYATQQDVLFALSQLKIDDEIKEVVLKRYSGVGLGAEGAITKGEVKPLQLVWAALVGTHCITYPDLVILQEHVERVAHWWFNGGNSSCVATPIVEAKQLFFQARSVYEEAEKRFIQRRWLGRIFEQKRDFYQGVRRILWNEA